MTGIIRGNVEFCLGGVELGFGGSKSSRRARVVTGLRSFGEEGEIEGGIGDVDRLGVSELLIDHRGRDGFQFRSRSCSTV